MASLIEQAALRLEQLRKTGAVMAQDVPQVKPAQRTPPKTTPTAPQGEDAPVVASPRVEIDLAALARTGIVTPDAPRSLIADQFRVIKRPLISNALGKGAAAVESGNLIMVTSALPGEGKTFAAINLAMSIATELDCTVMLVDADVARPSVMNVLGLPASPGLLDLVANDSTDIAPYLLKTNVEKLSILPSGMRHERATELLASDAMARLLDDMARRYSDRIIVFDSPPLLLTTESRVLAIHMGQVVVVVRAEETLQSDVTQALGLIDSCPVRLMLLNQASSVSTEGYGYGYGA
jgi:exopolysaccharide/PEP-CTERM locus tyrosine autokinase